jgi:2-hydroxy-6-oxonona-2,4-dienedioate hydrolase
MLTHKNAIRRKRTVIASVAVAVLLAAGLVWWRFTDDIEQARARAALNAVVVQTHCGPIEYQAAGIGTPVLMIHGSGGGHDQGMAFVAPLIPHGIKVIAMSRFGYLGTSMPLDRSVEAQADAHACLLDALGIQRAGVIGGSAGALSAMQMAIRHANRVSALALVVPIAYKPSPQGELTSPLSPWVGKILMRLISSDFLFWAGLHVARDQMIRIVLATPPDQVKAASPQEQARVYMMANNILPVSLRARGLQIDSQLTNVSTRYPLEQIRAPTLIISARDDGYGTYDGAQYTASQIQGARFIGYTSGGHVLVGHDDEVRSELVKLFINAAKP